jgi:hypothetical protein
MPRAACRANEEDDEPTSLGQFDGYKVFPFFPFTHPCVCVCVCLCVCVCVCVCTYKHTHTHTHTHTQGNSALGSQKRDGRFFPRSPRTYACGARVPFPPPFPFFPFSLFFLFFSWLPENLCMRRNGTIAVDFMW